VSLEPENHAFRASRSRIAISAFLTVGVTFLYLFVALRWGIVTRIHHVANAARKLELGQHARAKVHGRDDLGQLAAAFNAMADAIVEREDRVANARRRLQTLLDHMGQAIITFDARGKVLGDRSRQAEQLFGPTRNSALVPR
jgi:signal transduction histidine kinase